MIELPNTSIGRVTYIWEMYVIVARANDDPKEKRRGASCNLRATLIDSDCPDGATINGSNVPIFKPNMGTFLKVSS